MFAQIVEPSLRLYSSVIVATGVNALVGIRIEVDRSTWRRVLQRRAADERMVRRLIRQDKLGHEEKNGRLCLGICHELLHLARANMEKRPRGASQTFEVEEMDGRPRREQHQKMKGRTLRMVEMIRRDAPEQIRQGEWLDSQFWEATIEVPNPFDGRQPDLAPHSSLSDFDHRTVAN